MIELAVSFLLKAMYFARVRDSLQAQMLCLRQLPS